MKVATVYYSLDGNTGFICDTIAKVLAGDKFEIKTKKTMPDGFLKYFFCGKQVLTKETPEIEDLNFNSDNYDKIVLGSPCWASSIAPAMNSFLKKYPLKNKEIALLLCHAGGGNKAMEKWISLLENNGNKIIANLKLVNPLKFHPARSLSFAESWAEDIWK
jgi:flavodoxin